eukprot:COSAG02_NODE_999_length_15328_cov_8.086360_4_plen_90_part_00
MRRAGNADITLRQLLQGDKLEAYADGNTINIRATDGCEQTVGVGSLPPLIKCCINIGKHIDPDFDTSLLDYLLASVEQRCRDKAKATRA